MPGRIPDRWEAYVPLGKPIEGTRFITFKVPLEPKITSSLPKEEQFTPHDLVDKVKEEGHTLGLVIDLTNTKRYYRSQDFTRHNVKYAKIYTEGHVVPSRKVQRRFISIVDKFFNDDSNSDKLIGVHCTHGVNRTGYLVCRYMIDKLDFEPDKALAVYGEARGYPVERENYIEDLKKGKSEDKIIGDDDMADVPEEEFWKDPVPEQWSESEHQNGHVPFQQPPYRHQHHSNWNNHNREYDNRQQNYQQRWGSHNAGWGSSLQNNSGPQRSYGYSHNQNWRQENGRDFNNWQNWDSGFGPHGHSHRHNNSHRPYSRGHKRGFGKQHRQGDFRQKRNQSTDREPKHQQ